MFEALDLIGTFVFAVAGGFRGTRHRLDLLGVLILAVVTGTGGGMMRDALLGDTPVAALADERYLLLCLLGGATAFVAAGHVAQQWNRVMIADAVGLGVFAAIGAAKAAVFGLGPVGVVLMAALTATGGGVLRDVFVGTIPAVFRHQLYATAALVGGGVYLLAEAIGTPEVVSVWLCAMGATALRFWAMHGNLRLPTAEEPPEPAA